MTTSIPSQAVPLSDRERQVLQAAANGLTVRQTGARLYLAENTIKVHRRNVLRKLGARNMTEAVARTGPRPGMLGAPEQRSRL